MDNVDKELVLSAGGEGRREASMGGDQAEVQDHFRFAYHPTGTRDLTSVRLNECLAPVLIN